MAPTWPYYVDVCGEMAVWCGGLDGGCMSQTAWRDGEWLQWSGGGGMEVLRLWRCRARWHRRRLGSSGVVVAQPGAHVDYAVISSCDTTDSWTAASIAYGVSTCIHLGY
jgi:hypothetical protein